MAVKVAETYASKRAFATFGRTFGVELYRGGRAETQPLRSPFVREDSVNTRGWP